MIRRANLEPIFDQWALAGITKCKLIACPISAIFLAIIAACASSPNDEPNRVNQGFSTISIVSKEEVINAVTSDTESERNTEGSIGGAAAGAVGGALIGAAACAPTVYMAPLCAVVYGIGGAVSGGIAGGMAGSMMWGSTGLSDEDVLYLKEEASHLDSARDMNNELAEALRKKLPSEIFKPATEADLQTIPLIETIKFDKTHEDLVRIKVSVSLTFAAGTGSEVNRYGKLHFSAKSEERLLDDWLDTNGQAIGNAIDNCLEKIAVKMANTILEKRAPPEVSG